MRTNAALTAAIVAAAVPATAVDHLLITEFVVTPTTGEFVEIYNPTGSAIDLTDYYLSDAVTSNDNRYVNIVDGSASVFTSDFIARFPAGASVDAGAFVVVSIDDDIDFTNEYGIIPDFELNDDSAGTDSIPDMVDPGGLIGRSSGLTNSGEMLVLFHWDGASDLVQDVDYLVWDDRAEGADKTGVAKDGPDADSDSTSYLPDTPIESQTSVNPDGDSGQPHQNGFSASRAFPFEEVGEISDGGNGIFGADETSEDLSEAGNWSVHAAPSPGTVVTDNAPELSMLQYSPCVPSGSVPVSVSVSAIDDNLAEVLFLLSADGAVTFDTTAMVDAGGDVYTTETGPFPDGFAFDFKVVATDDGGNAAETHLGGFVYGSFTAISDIQADTTEGGASALVGSRVNVTGYVTVGSGALSSLYFYIADDTTAAPWSGIKVYAPVVPSEVSEGDWIEIAGVVDEYFDETEIIASENDQGVGECVTIVQAGAADVKAMARTSGSISGDESLEGVLVMLNDATVADTLNKYEEWAIDDGSGSVPVTRKSGYAYTPVLGDGADVTGIVTYSFGKNIVHPRDGLDLDEVGFYLEIAQYDNFVGGGGTWTESVEIHNGSAAPVTFNSATLDYAGPVSGDLPLFKGNVTFPPGMLFANTASVRIPGAAPLGTYATTTTLSSTLDGDLSTDGVSLEIGPVGARLSVPNSGAGAPSRKITNGGTVSWTTTLANTSGASQTVTGITANLERFSHSAGAWVSTSEVALFSGSATLASGDSREDSASVPFASTARSGLFRVSHTVTFASGIDTQTESFFFRHDS